MEENKLKLFQEWINDSNRIVFFGGAGVSTESGIPDFRSVDGLYNQKYKFPPEQIISHSFFMSHTEEFYCFYRDKMVLKNIKPNITHYKLAELEQKGKLTAVVTQNIDGLHQKAGSRKVLELHGSILRNYCMNCGEAYDTGNIIESSGIPACRCGGIIKPDVVLYGEGLKEDVINESVKVITEADMLIVAGTSLSVYPAAGLIDYYKGNRLVLINRSATPYDNEADLLLRESLGDVFKAVE